MGEILKTDRTSITRLPKRGHYDEQTIYQILDEALVCTLAFANGDTAFQIPTGFCRIGDQLYVHGSVGSFYMREIVEKSPTVSIGVTLIDGLVLARSAFHHSVNYRSVVMFAKPRKVTDDNEFDQVLEMFTNKMQPGRWNDVRKPTQGEWKATMVIAFTIEEASAKVRTGPPVDDEEDYNLDVWAGIVPLKMQRGNIIPDPKLKVGVAVPSYLAQ